MAAAPFVDGQDLDRPSGDGDCGQKFILVVDVGTTTLRCHIYNKAARIVAQAEMSVRLLCKMSIEWGMCCVSTLLDLMHAVVY